MPTPSACPRSELCHGAGPAIDLIEQLFLQPGNLLRVPRFLAITSWTSFWTAEHVLPGSQQALHRRPFDLPAGVRPQPGCVPSPPRPPGPRLPFSRHPGSPNPGWPIPSGRQTTCDAFRNRGRSPGNRGAAARICCPCPWILRELAVGVDRLAVLEIFFREPLLLIVRQVRQRVVLVGRHRFIKDPVLALRHVLRQRCHHLRGAGQRQLLSPTLSTRNSPRYLPGD